MRASIRYWDYERILSTRSGLGASLGFAAVEVRLIVTEVGR
jgi:hypothetical protein